MRLDKMFVKDAKRRYMPEYSSSQYVWLALFFMVMIAFSWVAGFLSHAICNSWADPAPTMDALIPGEIVATEEISIAPTATSSPGILTPTWTPQPTATPTPTLTPSPTLTPTPLPAFFEGPIEYGTSYGGRPLYAYRLGTGPSARAIIGAIHGGYEWNTVDVVSETLDYYQTYTTAIPANVTLYLIPCANPDGYAAGTDAVVARMNGNGVDLNRNWDYEWQPTATHGRRPVKAGDAPFSEPETAHLRDFILERDIELAIFYHSAMGVVFSGADRESSATFELTEMLSEVTQYPHNTEGIYGQITTGDAIDWLSTQGIAATEIELTTHASISDQEMQRNLDGIQAFLAWTIPEKYQATPPASALIQGEYITHTVKADETLGDIMLKYGVTQTLLIEINNIENPDLLTVGQELLIPRTNN